MAWALLRLAAATAEPRFRATALEAIAHERTLFSAERGNWWDLRDVGPGGTPGHCVTAWCHGAPGIGLARLDTLGTLDDAEVRAEIGAAVDATIRTGFGDAHALCHGDLGNVELVARAARALGDERLRDRADRIARGVVDDVRASGWQCGNPMRVQSPGLMTGLAGIGYGFLRLAAPERVPSVLLLEPPR
jgi:lantibiotic modifying enzyme